MDNEDPVYKKYLEEQFFGEVHRLLSQIAILQSLAVLFSKCGAKLDKGKPLEEALQPEYILKEDMEELSTFINTDHMMENVTFLELAIKSSFGNFIKEIKDAYNENNPKPVNEEAAKIKNTFLTTSSADTIH